MTRAWLAAVLLGLPALRCRPLGAASRSRRRPTNSTTTAVPGIRVGHHTLSERPTGCTVVLVDGDAVGGVSQRGGAPGTRETDLLDPLNLVDKVNAVVLSGGSAFGLDAATGVVRWLEERGIGWPTAAGRVPIVTGGDPVRPRRRRQPEDSARRRLRLPGSAGRHRPAGRRGQRRRRARARRSASSAAAGR